MSGGSSRGKGKEATKGTPFLWEGSVGLNVFDELVDQFLPKSKSDFSKESPLRGYDNWKEPWPKYRHGEDCLVQMFTEGLDGGRCFFKCPRAWCSDAEDNCGFTRWVDPRPIYPHVQYIFWMQERIFDLKREVTRGYKDDEDDGNNTGASSQEALCNDPYCPCPNHKKGPPPPPPPSPPPTLGGYCGERVVVLMEGAGNMHDIVFDGSFMLLVTQQSEPLLIFVDP